MRLEVLTPWFGDQPTLSFVMFAALTVVWSAAFARGRGLRRVAERAALAPPSRSTWASATGLSAAALIAVLLVDRLTLRALPGLAWLIPPVSVVVFAAVVLDVVDDLRDRRGGLVRVWTLHQPQHLDVVERVLAAAELPFHVCGANLRTLLAFFGPFVPVDVLVPREHAAAAARAIAAVVADAAIGAAAAPTAATTAAPGAPSGPGPATTA